MTSWTKDLDDAVVLATKSGRWHILLFCLLCGLAAVPTAFLAFSQVFTSATPQHWCSAPPEFKVIYLNMTAQGLRELFVPRTSDGTYSSCSMYDVHLQDLMRQLPRGLDGFQLNQSMITADDRRQPDFALLRSLMLNGTWSVVPCRYGWTFDRTYYDRTLVTEMELVCDRGWWPRTSNTLFWVGSIFGNLLFGWLSDRWGRRPTILTMVYLEVPIAIATCFAPDYTSYTVLRVAGGLFFPALYQIPFILALELMPPDMRTYAGMVIGMMFASAMCVLALLAYLLRDWFALSLATSVPFLVLYSCYWLVPESPRWLVGRGRVSEAEDLLRRMARANGISLKHGFLMKLHKHDLHEGDNEIIAVPAIQINGHLLAYSDKNKDEPRLNTRRQYLKTFKPEPNQLEVETAKTTDIERMLAFEVAEIVNKKSRKKNIDGKSNAEAEKNEMLRNEGNIISEDVIVVEESQISKCTQTDTLKSPTKTLKKKSINFFNRIIGKNVTGFELDLKIENDERIDRESLRDIQATPLDIIRYPIIRKKFMILTFDWIANAVVYNGLSYNSSNLGVNDYLAFFIGGAVELPAYVIAWKYMDRFGRRWLLCVTMFVGGLSCLSCVLVSEERPWVTVSLAMVGRLCVAASFGVFYVFVGELLPTVLRAQAMAAASFLSGLGLLACPYIVHLAVYSRVVPLAIMGTLSLAGAVASLFLPETLHQPLPQTTRDGEQFGRNFKIFSCPARVEE